MTIRKPPRSIPNPSLDEKKMEQFMNAAPDATVRQEQDIKNDIKQRKNSKPGADETVQIALKLTQRDLDRIDEAAASQRISRAGFLRMAAFRLIDSTS